LSKLFASAIEVTSALAPRGPIPGIFSNLRLSSLLRCQALAVTSRQRTAELFRSWEAQDDDQSSI
jgi:hypothetical protein